MKTMYIYIQCKQRMYTNNKGNTQEERQDTNCCQEPVWFAVNYFYTFLYKSRLFTAVLGYTNDTIGLQVSRAVLVLVLFIAMILRTKRTFEQ